LERARRVGTEGAAEAEVDDLRLFFFVERGFVLVFSGALGREGFLGFVRSCARSFFACFRALSAIREVKASWLFDRGAFDGFLAGERDCCLLERFEFNRTPVDGDLDWVSFDLYRDFVLFLRLDL